MHSALDSVLNHLGLRRLREFLRRVKLYIQITHAEDVLRRYFVMNAFDGAMTSLGIVVGSAVANVPDIRFIVGAILGGAMAMGLSGSLGTYMTERAERLRDVKDLENAMLTNLENSLHAKASRAVSIVAALVDGLAPIMTSTIAVIPLVVCALLGTSVLQAVSASVAASLVSMFLLGMYLGRIGKDRLLISGLKMLAAGGGVTLLALLLRAL